MAYPQTSFAATRIHEDSLVGRRREAIIVNTLSYQLDVLKKTGRYEAFSLRWHSSYSDPPEVWPIPNHLFWDSDVAKWIEGACYILKQRRLPAIEHAVLELVNMIRTAQQPDGYINIHYTVVEPGKRFTNLRDMHELYNAGHLIEAALAHHDLYGNDVLLEPMLRYVKLLCHTFGSGENQIHGYPGHPEIELALLRLYERTQNPEHLKLAEYFIVERGNPHGCDGGHYYDVEAKRRGDDPHKQPAFYPAPRSLWYHQAHQKIQNQLSIEGHSVRAVYLLTAVADLCRIKPGIATHDLRSALYRLWDNMVDRKMYVTGGIGAIKQWEGFGIDYFLPHGTDEGGCYSETCAAIGVMMLAQRILQLDCNARYADVMELCLYNAVLTAMSHDGKRFTYVNQLASSTTDLSKREDWFTVACCPPNIMRLLGQIGGYVWNSHVDCGGVGNVAVHLYIPSELDLKVRGGEVNIRLDTKWPHDGDVHFVVSPSQGNVRLRLRIPRWAGDYKLHPPCETAFLRDGYLTIPEQWLAENSSFTLSIPMATRWLVQHPYTRQNTVSLARGPLTYCVEDYDNQWVQDHFKSTFVDTKAELVETQVHDKQTDDAYVAITLCNGASRLCSEQMPPTPRMTVEEFDEALLACKAIPKLHFIPYYFRANRGGRGQMRVGLERGHVGPIKVMPNGRH